MQQTIILQPIHLRTTMSFTVVHISTEHYHVSQIRNLYADKMHCLFLILVINVCSLFNILFEYEWPKNVARDCLRHHMGCHCSRQLVFCYISDTIVVFNRSWMA